MSKNRKKSNLPSQPRQALHQIAVTKQELFAGPMPPPDILQKYNEIVPDAAERILTMAEKQSEHRQYLEKKVIDGRNRDSLLGIIAGTIVCLGAMAVSALLATSGHETTAAILVGTTLVSLVSTFIYGTRSSRAEREKKNRT